MDKGLGEVIVSSFDVYLDEINNAIQPDIIVVLTEHLRIIDPSGHIHGVPDILVEVLSPSNRDHDLVLKKELYERFGVKEYWIVDPEHRSTIVYASVSGRYQVISEDVGLLRSSLLNLSLTF